jgi:hypothetical protein
MGAEGYNWATLPLGDINTEAWSSEMGLDVRLTTVPCKKKIVEKPLRNSAGFCGRGQGLSWAVKPRKERRRKRIITETMLPQVNTQKLIFEWSLGSRGAR